MTSPNIYRYSGKVVGQGGCEYWAEFDTEQEALDFRQRLVEAMDSLPYRVVDLNQEKK